MMTYFKHAIDSRITMICTERAQPIENSLGGNGHSLNQSYYRLVWLYKSTRIPYQHLEL